MRFLLISLFFLVYLYPFELAGIPVGLRTIMSFFGVILFVSDIFLRRPRTEVVLKFKLFLKLILAMIPFMMISVLTGIINSTFDFQFARLGFSFVLIFFAAYFLIYLLKKLKFKINIETVSKFVVSAVFIQSLLSFLMFFSPSFQSFVFSVISFSDLEMGKIKALLDKRVIGFGRSFFSAGIYSSLGLLFLGYLIKWHNGARKYFLLYILLFFLIFGIGMMMARTTIVGAILSLLYIFFPHTFRFKFSRFRINFKKALYFIGIPILVAVLILLLLPNFVEDIDNLLKFGFELFINIAEGKGVETDSTDTLMTMFKFPDNTITWFIGDGYWDLPNGQGYYMNTDVGYSRMLFYFGVWGMISFLGYQLYLAIRAFGFSFFSKLLIALILVLNVKGFMEISTILILFYLVNMNRNKAFV